MTSPFALTAAAAIAALAGGAAGWALGRRRVGRASSRAERAGARLAADLETARELLRDYIVDREAAEETLRESEQRYRLLFQLSPRPLWVYDVETLRFLAVNDAALGRYGWSREEFLQMTIADLHDPAELPEVQAVVARAGDRELEVEWRHRTRDGEMLDVVVASHALLFQGRRARIVLVEDVTERRRAEAAVRETATRYREMFEQHGAVQLLVDQETLRIVDANEAACAFYGYDRATLTSMNIGDLMVTSPEELQSEAARASGQTRAVGIYQGRLASGEVRTVEVHSARVHLNGRTMHYAIVHDVTERLRAEEALAASEERYRLLIARAAYGIYRSSPEGRFLEANPALVHMLGYESEAEVTALDVMRDVYVDGTQRAHLVARSGESLDGAEVDWRRRDGTPIRVRLFARTVRDREGRILYYEGIAEDVTERLRQEELLRRSERMASLGHTLAGAAHELNNPLAAICGFAQLMLRDAKSEDDRSALETIHHEAARAGKIVKDLLTFSRRQEGERRTPVDVNAIAGYILESQRYAIETRGIRRELSLAPGLPMVLGDRSQLEQVLLNLVVNARQALEPALDAPASATAPGRQPWIAVRTRIEDGQVRIEVEDNGPGIPAAQLSRIWDPFWTTKPEGEGTGLGLSVVHGIVAAHGGTIEVTSAVGEGTRFLISLPPLLMAPAPSSDAAADASMPDEPAARALDVLLVDDEAAILGLLTRFLSRRGHAVIAVPDGAQAVRLASQTPFDVVICDLRMPGMDGAETIRRMRALPTCAATRFIVATGDDADSRARRAVAELEVAAVLEKPYEIERLRELVEAEPAGSSARG